MLSTSPMARDYSSGPLPQHLVKSGEILGMMALTEINLADYQDLMQDMQATRFAAALLINFTRRTRDRVGQRGDMRHR